MNFRFACAPFLSSPERRVFTHGVKLFPASWSLRGQAGSRKTSGCLWVGNRLLVRTAHALVRGPVSTRLFQELPSGLSGVLLVGCSIALPKMRFLVQGRIDHIEGLAGWKLEAGAVLGKRMGPVTCFFRD